MIHYYLVSHQSPSQKHKWLLLSDEEIATKDYVYSIEENRIVQMVKDIDIDTLNGAQRYSFKRSWYKLIGSEYLDYLPLLNLSAIKKQLPIINRPKSNFGYTMDDIIIAMEWGMNINQRKSLSLEKEINEFMNSLLSTKILPVEIKTDNTFIVFEKKTKYAEDNYYNRAQTNGKFETLIDALTLRDKLNKEKNEFLHSWFVSNQPAIKNNKIKILDFDHDTLPPSI